MNRNPKDTANYLVFIQALRKALDAKYSKVHKLITLAVGTNPFNDENQNPTKSLDSGWAKAVDSFYLMVNTNCLQKNSLITKSPLRLMILVVPG